MQHPESRKESPDPNHRLTRALNWFEETIREWALESENPGFRLEYLHDTLKDRMELVQISLGPHDDPQVIFEVLNHRGVPLDAADLVKNLLFQVLDEQGKQGEAEQLLLNEWLPLDHSPWRDDVTTGRVRRKRIDLLLAYWLSIMTSSEVSVDHLFADFKKWLVGSGREASEVMVSIRHYANTMESLRRLPANSATSQLLERMDWLQHNTPWPIVLYLHANESVPESQRDRAARALESFLVRRTICRLTTKDYNRLFLHALAQVMAAAPEVAGEALEQALLDQTAESRYWPPDLQFAAALSGPALYNVLSAKHIKMLFAGLENHLHTSKSEPVPRLRTDDKRLNIEHLLPQTWEKNWPIEVNLESPEYPARRLKRDQSVHQLGNLTLITTRFNSSLSNRAWAEKSREIRKHSVLRITTGSVLTVPDSNSGWTDEAWSSKWTEEQISLRTNHLVEAALRLWSRPPEVIVPSVASEEPEGNDTIDLFSTLAMDWSASPTIEPPVSIESAGHLAQLLITLIGEAPNVKPDFHSGPTYIRFLPPQFDVPELMQSVGWTPSRRILLFQFHNQANNLELGLHVGPADQRIRNVLIDGARERFVGLGRKKRWSRGTRWTSIYSQLFPTLNSMEGQDHQALRIAIQERWEQFCSLELPAIVEAMNEPVLRLRNLGGTDEQDNRYFELQELAWELAMSAGPIVPDFSDWHFVRFLPEAWDRPELQRSVSWTLSNRILMFEFWIHDDAFRIVLLVGPGPPDVRDELVNGAQSNIPPFQWHDTHRARRTGSLFTHLFSRVLARPTEYGPLDTEALKNEIRAEWKRFLDEDLYALVEGMSPAIERLLVKGLNEEGPGTRAENS